MQPTAEQVRALKDEDFRLTLGQGHQVHPAGEPADELYVTAAVMLNTCESWGSCGRVCSY
ncbi:MULTISPECIES: hypothetical protein [Kitasatospora]|uniref:Uncharacterized protein n=1 Tax=Kitasatospora cathayae TaxID=3004092 RepID=A0ABY7QBM3_9ACTN|nr:hypothetical protein [Kitasatospora sp. HUAS 3-15]WBP90107.1 hypothetical protein O1G21_32465 [Kitasatospora sp. HUAS 3-15]